MLEWLSWPGVAILGLALFIIYRLLDWSPFAKAPAPVVPQIGDLTLQGLELYCGVDPFRPILLAVKGVIYDVTPSRSLYGPGSSYHAFAGRECSRALACMTKDEEDCCAKLDDLDEEQLATLDSWIEKFNKKYHVVGRVVPSREFTIEELQKHDGHDPSVQMLLAIEGVVYDVSNARQFYGPNGMYAFAGHEVARALALYSEEPADYTSNLDGLGPNEIDQLRSWQDRFRAKYHIVGKVVEG